MFGRASRKGAQDNEAQPNTFDLSWSSAQRWNPQYNVPRNSLDTESCSNLQASKLEQGGVFKRRDPSCLGPNSKTRASGNDHGRTEHTRSATEGSSRTSEEGFSNLSHWLETLAELYMNDLDNRARWDPRWLNITHRERFEGLRSASVTVLDFLTDASTPQVDPITNTKHLAATMQARPENCEVRVLLVSDVSRFLMGALGQMYSIDPEFWFEHLVNSGYAASDSQLKVFNAVWMNWATRETRFRHRALPGPGQRTEWNLPRRTRGRGWTHLRWGRLGQLHYLGRKGFYEDEIDRRLGDGRWVTERDVVIDKYGRLMTKKREARINSPMAERVEKRGKKNKVPRTPVDQTHSRVKASNVYRAYSTFESLPKNVHQWFNRDLRVMAPEATSYWTGLDQQGKKTIVLVCDPVRNMKDEKTMELIPAVTFMPRAMEIESYSDEELWRSADAGELYLDPPPARLSKSQQKKALKAERLKAKKQRLQGELEKKDESIMTSEESVLDHDFDSSDTSDSEYDEEYEKNIREDYSDPKPHARDREFARKYSLSTHELILRHLSTISTAELVADTAVIPGIIMRLLLDDSWRLLSEIRLEIDQFDSDFGADLYDQLVELVGNATRQNVCWVRTTLQELCEWTSHLSTLSATLSPPDDLVMELNEFQDDLQALKTRAEGALNLLTSSMGLAQSSLVIGQTSGINKLTELAFFFIPVSFITSVFSMQVHELSSKPPRIWTWGLSLTLIVLITYFIRSILRSPSVRIFMLHMRATIINRFTSPQANSASRRLNTVGNRAIIKFSFFFVSVWVIVLAGLIFIMFVGLLALGGLWLGLMATALYFIITQWPDPAVLVPCFISIPVAAAGWWVSFHWFRAMYNSFELYEMRILTMLRSIFPERWTNDIVDDDDLAQEGVKTYARQALVLAT